MVIEKIDVNNAIKKEGFRRGFSDRTIESYIFCCEKFLKFSGKSLDKISKQDAREFLSYLSEQGKAGSTLNVYHMAIRFLLEDILNKKMKLNIKYSRVPKKLPVVLNKEEIKKLFSVIENSKHKLMLQLMYGAGLRVSELVNLKISDLNIGSGFGFVRAGKGNKDRMFIIPESLKIELRKLIEGELRENYLFVSNRTGKYNVRSLQEIIKKACKTAGLNKISCHTLRHSFATHLIEQGQSITDVQLLLGHASPETTQVYLHTSIPGLKIKSPIDSL